MREVAKRMTWRGDAMMRRPRWELFGLAGLLFSAVAILAPAVLLPVTFLLWVVLGGLMLGIRHLALDLLTVGVLVTATVPVLAPEVPIGVVLVFVLVGASCLTSALRRDRAMGALLGDSADADALLIDLRDSVRAQGSLPPLPEGWELEHEHRPARDEAFSGDFLVVRRTGGDHDRLDLALVDVSGHGRTAGARSVMLHGAFGALLRTVPRRTFLEAANSYLVDQQWDEGFATAVHVSVELRTGRFTVSAAGHPPPLQRQAETGTWAVLEGDHGPVLGVLADVPFPVVAGALGPGDSLLLYTDGLVEGRRIDLATGIDQLRDSAELVLSRQLPAGATSPSAARAILGASKVGPEDDRTVVVLQRQPASAESVTNRTAGVPVSSIPTYQ